MSIKYILRELVAICVLLILPKKGIQREYWGLSMGLQFGFRYDFLVKKSILLLNSIPLYIESNIETISIDVHSRNYQHSNDNGRNASTNPHTWTVNNLEEFWSINWLEIVTCRLKLEIKNAF
jgi:hypothetical protein